MSFTKKQTKKKRKEQIQNNCDQNADEINSTFRRKSLLKRMVLYVYLLSNCQFERLIKENYIYIYKNIYSMFS